MIQQLLAIIHVIGVAWGAPVHAPVPAVPRVADVAVAMHKDVAVVTRAIGLPHAQAQTQANTPALDAASAPRGTARAVLAVDEKSGRAIIEHDADTVMPLASLTKLVSTLTFVRVTSDLNEYITIVDTDIIEDKSALAIGDRIKKKDLIALALIGSSNSAAHTLMRASGMTDDAFVSAMHDTARDIGLSRSVFVEPTGLDARNSGSSRDVYRMLSAARAHPLLSDYLDDSEHIFSNGIASKKVFSTNIFLLGILPFGGRDIIAAKTGFIEESGYHFAMFGTDSNDKEYTIIVMGAQTHFDRFTIANDVLVWLHDHL